MAVYYYVARDRNGKKKFGTIDAASEEECYTRLSNEGLIVISLKQYSVANQKRKKKKLHYAIKTNDFLFFARQMAVMLDAGVPLIRVISVISDETSSILFKKCLTQIKEDVSNGWSLANAIERHPNIFSNVWVNVVKTGEATGRLGLVLNRLADYLEMRASFKKKIVSAMVYPAILMVVTILAVLFLTIFIIPKFKQLFTSMGGSGKLPFLTQAVMSFSEGLRANFLWVIIGIVVAGFLLKTFIKTPEGKALYDKVVLKLPLIGDVILVSLMNTFAMNMSLLVESGIPILNALEITENSIDNVVIRTHLAHIISSIKEGKTLAVAMEETGFFEGLITQMVSVGEEVGEISQMFQRVGDFYRLSMENILTAFTSAFEPLMLVFMAVVIGVLVASIFLPIFNIANIGMQGV